MKTRNDFVSNSSSCSFIVSDPKKMFDTLHKLLDDDVDWFDADFFNGITVIAIAKKPDEAFFKKQIASDDISICSWCDELQMNMSMYVFANFSDEIVSKLTSVSLECDDYDHNAVANLSLLKKALCNLGIDADSSCSEHDLLFDGNNNASVFAKIASVAFSGASTLFI